MTFRDGRGRDSHHIVASVVDVVDPAPANSPLWRFRPISGGDTDFKRGTARGRRARAGEQIYPHYQSQDRQSARGVGAGAGARERSPAPIIGGAIASSATAYYGPPPVLLRLSLAPPWLPLSLLRLIPSLRVPRDLTRCIPLLRRVASPVLVEASKRRFSADVAGQASCAERTGLVPALIAHDHSSSVP
jgi:hypothetical protein